MAVELKSKVRDVPDFPKPGIVFKDVMPLLADAEALRETVDALAEWAAPRRPDVVLARGGTAQAKCELVEQLGGEVVGVAFIIALDFLNGRDRLSRYDVHALISYG